MGNRNSHTKEEIEDPRRIIASPSCVLLTLIWEKLEDGVGRPLVPISSDEGVIRPPHLHLLKLLLREASELILKHEMEGIK